MRRVLYDNPIAPDHKANTVEKIVPGQKSFEIDEPSWFSVGDLILLEEQGSERNEVHEIASISSSTITLVDEPLLFHKESIKLTILDYDKYVIKDTNDTILVEDEIDYSSETGGFEYIELKDNTSFKIFYKNSKTAAEDLQDTIGGRKKIAYLTYEEITSEIAAASTVDKSIIYFGLQNGLEVLQDSAFFSNISTSKTDDYFFTVDVENKHLIDFNGDGEIDKFDIVVFEQDNNSGITYFKNYLITKIDERTNNVYAKEKLPSLGRTVHFSVPLAHKSFSSIRSNLKRVSMLSLANHLLLNTENENVKNGILNWSAGGTNVTKQPNAVSQVVESNKKEIDNIVQNILTKIYTRKTRLRTTRSFDRERYSGGSIPTHLRRR